MIDGPVFVDSNVLLYCYDSRNDGKRERAREWISFLWRTRRGCLSWQVLNEFYVNASRACGLSAPDARRIVHLFEAWRPLPVDGSVVELAWGLADANPLSHWDSLIVAAAAIHKCTTLLTEDLQAGYRYGSVTVVDPFDKEPPAFGPQSLVGG